MKTMNYDSTGREEDCDRDPEQEPGRVGLAQYLKPTPFCDPRDHAINIIHQTLMALIMPVVASVGTGERL